ncbi:MAG: hypothetical protein H6Q15_460 [Bacteroidetes bacterium]|nr:hypothetical protein [Bacteroidota bacterium]
MLKVNDEVYKYYFYFIQERMNIFWNKYELKKQPWTNDIILKENKFTNVYRASDRISQYLIKNIIYDNLDSFNEKDILFRILIFKIFNKVETWEYLENKIGPISIDNFNISEVNTLLTERMHQLPIYNNAYMMTGTHSKYNYLTYKHEKWLQMVMDEIVKEKIFEKILSAKSLDRVYFLLRERSFIGDFLAYQYTIDLNYSPVIDFDENSFVKAGIGSIRGIKKCFNTLGNSSFEDAIRYTHDNFEFYQQKYGFTEFINLFGRQPTLIDIQNCFCETDKYLRVKMPELQVDNIRIKQKYKVGKPSFNLFFPPKWNINNQIQNTCIQQNTKVLTLF